LKLLASAIKDKTKRGNITRNIKKLDISKLDSENLSTIALIYILLTEIDKAKELLNLALERDDVSAYVYFRLAVISLLEGDLEKSKEQILKGLEIENRAEAWYNLGYIYDSIEDEEKAKDAYLKGWDVNPFRYPIAQKAMRMLKKYELLDEYESSLEDELKDIKDDRFREVKFGKVGLNSRYGKKMEV